MLVETSLGEAGSQLLESIIQEKNDHQYTLATTSGEAAEELVSGARQMYERARAAVRRAGYPVP
jgi:DNA-binding transcriptional regulator LsrR (DeoR family)